MLTINGKNPETITIGGNAVESIAIQGEIVWQIGADITPYFFIRNEYQGANTISITKHADSQGNYPSTGATLEYSYDKDTWNPVSFSGTTVTIPIANYHDIVYLRSSDGFSEFRYTPAWYSLDCTNGFIAGGDIKTLIDYTDSTINTIPECAFYKMFTGSNTIQSVSTLHFYGITTVDQYGMQEMFYDTSLTTSFDLPDLVTLGMSAMKSCFEACASLNTVPNMPYLTVLGDNSMTNCFTDCTSITSTPLLQRIASLGSGSLMNAFRGCTALTTGPDFHNLTHIGQSALYSAFEGSGLAVMPDFTSVNRIDLYGMRRTFAGCHSLTTGFEIPLLDTINQSVFEECFDACDALVTPPVLEGVRVVAQDGMKYMFKGCSALLEGMQLKDITTIYSGQGVGGMNHLYDSCTSLNKAWAPTPSTWNTDAMEDWLYGVAATGVVIKDLDLTIPLNSTSGVPVDWTVDTNNYKGLSLNNISNTTGEFYLYKYGGAPSGRELEYSLDGATWTAYDFTNLPHINVPSGKTIYLRGNNVNGFNNTYTNGWVLMMNVPHDVSGNIMSLIDKDNFDTANNIPSYGLCNLFYHNTYLVNAENMHYGAVTAISQGGAISRMFDGCTSLLTGPNMRQITDTPNYYGIDVEFNGCSSLTTIYAPNVTSWKNIDFADWVVGVPGSGTFYAPAGVNIPTGNSGIPSGWTRVDYQ